MDSAFIHQAANELVQTAGTRNIKQIARSCSLDISETSRIKDMLGLLSLYFDKPLILNRIGVHLHDQVDDRFHRRGIKVLGLAVIISALKFVRRSCSTVAYKAHLLPYVATYPLFRA